jgi:hypothetical protein
MDRSQRKNLRPCPMPYNKTPQSSRNNFLEQSKIPTTNNSPYKKSKESTNVWQDKGVLTIARAEAYQPDPLQKGLRAGLLNNDEVRSQKTNPARVKLVHTTLHLHPLVRRMLEQKAAESGVSISAIGAQALYEWATSTIERQYATTLKTELRQMFREELTAFGNRIVFFLMKIAFSVEQARILTTNVLKWVAKLAGLTLKAYYKMVDDSSDLAKKNIIAKAPQIKGLMEKWEGLFTDEKSTAQGKAGTEKTGRRNA